MALGKGLGPKGAIIGLDVDIDAVRRAQSILKQLECRVILVNSNFSEISKVVREQGFEQVDLILADLGVCSVQLEDEQMGLSFQRNMPLDMRMDKRLETTAADIVNRADEQTLADLIYKYGEERASRRIAKFIVERRRREQITTTGQLAAIVVDAMGRRGQWTRIHPATRTFQALRIAVNDEMGNLACLLDSAPGLLKKDGYAAIISFHSLEDRLVKMNFKDNGASGVYRLATKKPITPTREEIMKNRRSRSAKLRIAQKN